MATKPRGSLDTRTKKAPNYKSFRLSGRIAPSSLKVLPSVWTLFRETLTFLWKHKIKMLKFIIIYLLAYIFVVKGFSEINVDTQSLKEELTEIGGGNIEAVLTFVVLYWSLLSSTTFVYDDLTNFFQLSVFVIFSLAFIWLIRKLHIRNSTATVKQAFYRGMRPLIPFSLVLSIMVIEILPAAFGALVYSTAQVATTATETELLGVSVLMILSIVLSIYLLSGTAFALYIVTLPDMTPISAVRSSMNLLRIHRWVVLRKILGFFALLIVLGFFLALPFIIWIPQYAEIAFFVLSSTSFAVSHTYLYKLYRSLL